MRCRSSSTGSGSFSTTPAPEASGRSRTNGELIDNWDELIQREQEEEQVEENSDDNPPEIEQEQQPPVAVDDAFGARPGRATLLPVLLNDYDANADVLVITEYTPIDDSIGRLDLVTRNQQLLLTLPGTAVGTVLLRATRSATDAAASPRRPSP